MNKKAIQLSINAIMIIILAIVLLGVGLGFIKGMFGKTTIQLEEQISKEPSAPIADSDRPITLSRESIISEARNNEVIKVSIFNPTNKDWVFRDAVTLEETLCSIDGDGICFIDVANENCNDKSKDSDCKDEYDEYDCTQNSELGEGRGCVIVKGDDQFDCPPVGDLNYDINCNCNVDGYSIGNDPDCDPTEGVKLNIECSQGLQLEKITNPKEVKSKTSTEFNALLKINKATEKGTYLCKVGIMGFVGDSEKYSKDLTINIE